MSPARFPSRPNPTTSYDDAVQRIGAVCARDDETINPSCVTTLLAHGQRTPRAVVLLHGLTNSPFQFRALGEQLHARGMNVYIPRLPRQGFANRLTDTLKDLRADEILAAADDAVDIARGLGERVTVCGLSAGGMLAAWAAVERTDVDQAVMIAPAFSLLNLPMGAVAPLVAVTKFLPNQMLWWDPKNRDASGPGHAYPRFSTHALAEVYRVARHLYAKAATHKPRARSLVVVLNAKDKSISNRAALQMVERWRARGANVTLHTFDNLTIQHDIIDPTQPQQRIDTVYPTLIDLIDQPSPVPA